MHRVCRRPATQQCWTCSMDICDFCTRRQHWKGAVGLHWPLVNSPGSMLEQLGKRELELKRQHDALAYKQTQPDYRPQSELQVLRQFQDAIITLLHQDNGAVGSTPKGPSRPIQGGSGGGCEVITGGSGISNSSSSDCGRAVASPPTAEPWPAQQGPTLLEASSARASITCKSNTGGAASTFSSSSDNMQEQKQEAKQQKASTAFALPSPGSLICSPQPSVCCSSSSNKCNEEPTSSSIVPMPSGDKGRHLVAAGSSGAVALTGIKPLALNRCFQAWQAASDGVKQLMLRCYDNQLARFYMWTQTAGSVLLALYLPTGGGKVPPKLHLQATATSLLVQHKGFAPVLYRSWANAIDAGVASGISSWSSSDGQLLVLQVAKAVPGKVWWTCFQGDLHMGRSLQAPYRLVQLTSEVQLEFALPFWVHPAEDVEVLVGERGLTVAVDGVMTLHRSYFWEAGQAAERGSEYKVVDVTASSWCMLDNKQQQGQQGSASSIHACSSTSGGSTGSSSSSTSSRADKLLSISLVLPDPTDEEVKYKKGVCQNNAAAIRSCFHGAGKAGYAFFQEDEDEFGLQALLQAALFHTAGYTWLCPKPWESAAGAGSLYLANSGNTTAAAAAAAENKAWPPSSSTFQGGRWATEEAQVPAEVLQHLQWLRAAGPTDPDHNTG